MPVRVEEAVRRDLPQRNSAKKLARTNESQAHGQIGNSALGERSHEICFCI